MDDTYYVTLDHAADELGVRPVDLLVRASKGTLWTAFIGNTWVTTRQELERLRCETLPPSTARNRTPSASRLV